MMRTPETHRRQRPWTGPLLPLLWAACSSAALAQPLVPKPVAPVASAASSRPSQAAKPVQLSALGAAQRVRILTAKSHIQCPLAGNRIAVLSIDSPQEWAETLQQNEQAMTGRAIRWSREQVLVYAMNQQPTLGVSVEAARQVLALKSGVLFWPVHEKRPGPGSMGATALSRPCLVAVIKRSYFQRIRIVRK